MTTDNLFKQPNSWADRILLQIKSAGQSTDKPYVFLTSCVDAKGEDITHMVGLAASCTLGEVEHNCSLSAFKEAIGYSTGFGDDRLPIEQDHHISFGRSYYKGVACYYIDHSGIEYIWVNARSWKAEKVMKALEAAGVEVDVP